MFSTCAISFFRKLQPPEKLPEGIDLLYPHPQPEVQRVIQEFFNRFYSDGELRVMLIGINPGRFGAGITGINFTAPRQLLNDCGITHPFGESSELSAEFIYTLIRAYGGAAAFYSRFYIGSVSPIGFVRAGKNLNYYDDPHLLASIKPYAVQCLQSQLSCGIRRHKAICIGGHKNLHFLNWLNEEYHFFNEIISVPHPRFIMQYRRSHIEQYVQEYLSALAYCVKE
ncbi:uracil-DNA glycosylase family protein [Flavihumibacter sp. ZG627]|uniref:uracil-DNA glycosylase family protein n=1 Tax=Flavihumibacter sp. ZG627 TaxID=1463156 RepID=UPI00057EB821|nr:uracil-DNA glycosylase family protein [Flavihumibacter sp. ZG627]KIC92056.1 hypothetical protein HY58_00300 [Flavihumibacter sp. ZG627]